LVQPHPIFCATHVSVPGPAPSGGMNGNVSAQGDARALVGTPPPSIRQAYRADIQRALHRRAGPAGAAEAAGQLGELLARVQALPKKPRAAGVLPPSRAAAATAPAAVSLADPAEEPPPEPPPPAQPPQRNLIIEEDDDFAISLRSEVHDAQRRVFGADTEVTRLTHALRKCRVSLWSQQREHTAAERRVVQYIADHADQLPAPLREEQKRLEHEERILVNESIQARMNASRWFQVAKRQDGMLQQEQDGGENAGDREVAKILARHPAGAVFLAQQLPPDNDSDDGFDARHQRSKWTRWDDDDDEDEELPRDGGKRPVLADAGRDQVPPPPPPPPAHPLRDPLGYDDDGASSMVSSPSESASGDSSGGTPVGGSKLPGGMLGASGASHLRPKDRLAMDRESTSSSDESSDPVAVEVPMPRRSADV